MMQLGEHLRVYFAWKWLLECIVVFQFQECSLSRVALAEHFGVLLNLLLQHLVVFTQEH